MHPDKSSAYTLVGILVAVAGIAISVYLPEVRQILGLDTVASDVNLEGRPLEWLLDLDPELFGCVVDPSEENMHMCGTTSNPAYMTDWNSIQCLVGGSLDMASVGRIKAIYHFTVHDTSPLHNAGSTLVAMAFDTSEIASQAYSRLLEVGISEMGDPEKAFKSWSGLIGGEPSTSMRWKTIAEDPPLEVAMWTRQSRRDVVMLESYVGTTGCIDGLEAELERRPVRR